MKITLAVAWIAASTSGLAIIVHALGWVSLAFSLTILAPLTLVLLFAVLVRSDERRQRVLLNRIYGGLLAGVAGLFAYDVIRWVILVSGLVPFNPFRAIEVYGLLILDQYEDTTLTKAAGWGFHIWNGLSFAVMYALAFGRGRILWALGWAMLLEIAMLATYPSVFRMVMDWPFVIVGVIGHIAYGIAIGIVTQRSVNDGLDKP